LGRGVVGGVESGVEMGERGLKVLMLRGEAVGGDDGE